MESVEYKYSSGDLLEDRNTYFYTEFRGKAFLSAWREKRDAALDRKKTVVKGDADESPVVQLLDDIYLNILNRNIGIATALRMLLHLCQRFEVTKRLHGEYDNDWRPLNHEDYKKIERYIRFAEVLSIAYRATDRLVFLNTMLKCMDTLTAMTDRLNSNHKERLRTLILDERNHIRNLSQRL